jgi:CRISPR-associated protein Cas2
MAANGERYMRILVLFDLPTLTQKDRREANIFRRNLIKDGYHMLQLSVYGRICKGEDTMEKHKKRLQLLLPSGGNVRVLTVTEKQYASMEILIGSQKKEEKIGAKQLVLL